MTQSLSTQGLQKAFLFPFEDPDWRRKLAIGSAILFAGVAIPLGIPSIFLMGYCERVMRHIIQEDGEPLLPGWDDWGELFAKGLKLFGVGLLYSLPLLILFLGGYGVMMIGPLFEVFFEDRVSSVSLSGLFFFVSMFGGMGMFGLAMLIAVTAGFVTPAVLSHVVATDEFSAAFRAKEWWPIFRANLAGFVLSYVVVTGSYFVANFAVQFLSMTLVLCCLVPFVWSVIGTYVMLVSSALFAHAYREGVRNLSESTGTNSAA